MIVVTAWLTCLMLRPSPKASSRAWKRLQPDGGIDLLLQDGLGSARRELLDLDAALGGGDDANALDLAIQHEPEVKRAHVGLGLLDVKSVNGLARRSGLRGDQDRAEHALGRRGHFLVRAAQLDAARLAAAAGVNLRLDGPVPAAELRRHIDRLFGAVGDAAGRHVDPEPGQQLFRLIFVDIHDLPRRAVVARSRRDAAFFDHNNAVARASSEKRIHIISCGISATRRRILHECYF